MATSRTISVVLLFAMLALHQSLAEDAPAVSPAPVTDDYDFPTPVPAPTPESPSPTTPSDASSPPAPSLLDLGSPAPSPAKANVSSPSTFPTPDSQLANDMSQDSTNEEKSSGRGKKVGLAFGIVAGACVVGLGALVYKKRRENILRSQYGQDARGSLL